MVGKFEWETQPGFTQEENEKAQVVYLSNKQTQLKSGEYLSSTEIAKAAGVTYRQLDYWARRGYIIPYNDSFGSGDPRLWALEQIEELRDLKKQLQRPAQKRPAHTGVS